MRPTPRLGGIAPALNCTREVGGTSESPIYCERPATFHIIWDMEVENGLACDEHADEVIRRYAFAGMHPYEMVCSIGGARWLPDEDRCVVDDDDLGLVAVEMADAGIGSPKTPGPAVGGSESRVAPGQPADGERSAPPTCSGYTARSWSPTSPEPEDALCVNCGADHGRGSDR